MIAIFYSDVRQFCRKIPKFNTLERNRTSGRGNDISGSLKQ
nr:MAG TPA: hypothetical protein [Caudoviricetes sp.]